MGVRIKPLVVGILIPLAVGGLAALLTRESMSLYEEVAKPALSPPGWLFPIVWTLLYLLMGIASYLVFTSEAEEESRRQALIVYGLQLAANFLWPQLFFGAGNFLFAFLWLILLWLLIAVTIALFFRLSEAAGWLLVPYLLWVTFAGYLNLSVFLLNR